VIALVVVWVYLVCLLLLYLPQLTYSILVACVIFTICVVMQTAATAVPLFTTGRTVAGLGVGLISVLIPLYQSECSPKWIRGTFVSAYQFFLTFGLLLAAVVNNATHARNDSGSTAFPSSSKACGL
jgi:SP family sugar:H+ symporter-like MFS transporter